MLSALVLLPLAVRAYDFMGDSGLEQTAQGTGHKQVADMSLAEIVGLAISAILGLIGVVFLALMVYGGIIWMTAAGNEQRTQKAKQLITNSVIGLVIVVSAYAITAFIGSQLAP